MGDVVGSVVKGAMANSAGKRAARGINTATAAGTANLIPTQETGQRATSQMEALLGLSGDSGAAQNALRQFMDSAGFKEQLRAGTEAITGSAALGGVLQSGATAKALQDRGQLMAQQQLMNYLAMLDPLSARGVQASSGIAGMRQAGGTNAANARMGGGMARAESFGNAAAGFGAPQAISGWFGGGGTPTGGVPASADWSTGVPVY